MSLNVEILEQSFEKVKPRAEEFAASFYDNLFAAHPEVKPLFANTNMVEQREHLIAALVLVIENLRKPEVLGEALKNLGAKHVGYGTIPQHYPAVVGEALLTTFEQYLHQDWTIEAKLAWTDAFGAISALMLDGAKKDYARETV